MPAPAAFNHFPLGLRRLVRRGATCVMVWHTQGFVHSEVEKFRNELPVGERSKPYWVVRCPIAFLDRSGGVFTANITDSTRVAGRGFDTWDQAEDFYDQRARADAGHSGVARGVAGLRKIGAED